MLLIWSTWWFGTGSSYSHVAICLLSIGQKLQIHSYIPVKKNPLTSDVTMEYSNIEVTSLTASEW